MKKNLGVILMLLWSTLLVAESRESFVFLEKMNRVERHLASFDLHLLLHASFEKKRFPARSIAEYYDRYDAAVRQVALDARGSNHHALLTQFVEMKNRMKTSLNGLATPKEIRRTIKESRALKKGVEETTPQLALALTPEQNLLYGLNQMRLYLAVAARDYLATELLKPSSKTDAAMLVQNRWRFKKWYKKTLAYAYWDAAEKKQIETIKQAWSVLQVYLEKKHYPLVVAFGARYLDVLLKKLFDGHKLMGQ